MRILVIGASGFLGSKLFSELDKGHDVIGTYLNSAKIETLPNTCRLDLRDSEKVDLALKKWRPEVIVDCSGLTDPDFCEKEKESAYQTNTLGIQNLCRSALCKIVYFSTDFVFDGGKGSYSEADLPCPTNFYGLTKLLAETVVLSRDAENLVIRVSGLFGVSNVNNKFIRKLGKDRVHGCVDLFSSPTYINDLCISFDTLLKRVGLMHFGGPERMSRYDMLKMASDALGSPCTVIPVYAREMGYLAHRPIDTSLVSSVSDFQKTKVRDALDRMRYENIEGIH